MASLPEAVPISLRRWKHLCHVVREGPHAPAVGNMDPLDVLKAWNSVVGKAQIEPMTTARNRVWRVIGQDGRKWALKHLPEWPPGVSPVEEFRVLCYLQAAGLPIALPVITDSGLIAHNAENLGTDPQEKRPTGADAYALIPLLPNDPQRHESPQSAFTIGHAIGQLDRVLAGCPWKVTSFTDDPGPDALGDDYAKLPLELRRLVDPLRDQLWDAVTELPTQLTHGDCNSGNLLVHDGNVTGYIDLDHLPHSPRIRDLSYYLASRMVEETTDGNPQALADVIPHYITGYHRAHQLAERELTAVVPLVLVALIGGASWCLNGWARDPAGYRRNLETIEWIALRYSAACSGGNATNARSLDQVKLPCPLTVP